MRPSSLTRLVIIQSILLAACDGGDPAAIQKRVELQRFESCSALESYIKETAVREMREILDQQLKNYQEQQQWMGGWNDGGAMAARDAGAAPSQSAPAAPGEPAAVTKTNTQVAEVDEADFVKNDGKRILVLAHGKLQLAKSWPVNELSLVSTLAIEGTPLQMFLEKDRVVIFSSLGNNYSGSCFGGCYEASGGTTKVTIVDIANLASPKVTSELQFPGGFSNARRVGSAVRLVLTDSFRHPAGVSTYPSGGTYGSDWWKDLSKLEQVYQDLKRKNEVLIRAQPLAEWLPVAQRKLAGGGTAEVRYACSDFYRSNAPVKLGLVSIVSLNLDDLSTPPHRTSILGNASEIYASPSSLYVASRHWWWWGTTGQNDHTYLHKFDITDPSVARYVASGGVDGHLVDQFAMDEHKGFLRIATTVSTTVEEIDPGWWGGTRVRTETTNRLEVLREEAGFLVPTGSVEGLAKGERIMSARFQGDRGYLVTFRQVDPLFTLDLSVATAPRVVGELKVPGFSTYIHPLDANHLLTMGIHVPDPGAGSASWRERSIKLTIFDVTDFAAPKEKFTQLVGTAYGWSEANWEHKAFNFFAERKLLAIPFSDYSYDYSSQGNYWDSFVSELRVFRVDAQKGFTAEGALSMKDIYVTKNNYGWSYGYSPWVQRSVMAADGQGNDFVYAISDAGIRVAKLGALATPIQTALFEGVKYDTARPYLD